VIVDVKSVEQVPPVHLKQINIYLQLTGSKLGLLLNFNVAVLKEGIHRVVLGLEE
jgi:GxxExxY protein